MQSDESEFAKKENDASRFAELVERYIHIDHLTEALLHTLIDHVVIHEKEIIDGDVFMRVEIFYRFIGKVGDDTGEEIYSNPTKQAKSRVLNACK